MSEVNWAMVDAYAHSSDRSTRRAAEDFVLNELDEKTE